jgi:hypothetical protein
MHLYSQTLLWYRDQGGAVKIFSRDNQKSRGLLAPRDGSARTQLAFPGGIRHNEAWSPFPERLEPLSARA